MNAAFWPFQASGNVTAPPSKSAAHRALICAALSMEKSEVILPATNADIDATMTCLTRMGAEFQRHGETMDVFPVTERRFAPLDCGESGSTLRFLLPVAAALGGGEFTGEGRLPERPILELISQLKAHGMTFSSEKLPFLMTGTLTGGEFVLPGSVSSQFVSGLLLAAPLTGEDVSIRVTGLQSAAYVDMTRNAMQRAGVMVSKTDTGYFVAGGQRYRSPARLAVEGDWSSAAFSLALGALSGDVTVRGVCPESTQGDRAIADILKRMGADVTSFGDTVSSRRAPLHAVDVDVSGIPDLAPVLSVLMMNAEGVSHMYNCARLRIKESDRLQGIMDMAQALHGEVQLDGDTLTIWGHAPLHGGLVDGKNDHRMVMAAAVAASVCDGMTEITDVRAVVKSYPGFFQDYQALGGKTNVLDVWQQD